jgi:hypothetical protein
MGKINYMWSAAMNDNIRLVWSYTPTDFFEAPFETRRGPFHFQIQGGEITVSIAGEHVDVDEAIVRQIYSELEDIFMGAQVVVHKPFSLPRNHTTYRKRPDGGEDVAISVSTSSPVFLSGKVDTKRTDKDGNVVSDTRADREAKMMKIAELSLKYRRQDAVANAILNSFKSAVDDRKNYFVHLYEIIEALEGKFGKDKDVRDNLGVSVNKPERLHKLANVLPLEEGRHRGVHHSQLRKATEKELEDGREIAQTLIYAYLEYLDRNASGP